jgi:Cof subfamily protein (haloacid dehalogenase superfamily)
VVATDFDHTLVWQDGEVRPRTLAALHQAREAGLHVIIATGRMVRSIERAFPRAVLGEPVICYQGAVVVDVDGRWLTHHPIDVELAREAIVAVQAEGYSPNVYVGEELYVSEESEWSRAYAVFQKLTINAVGDLVSWLDQPPTKLILVGDPDELDQVEIRLEAIFDGRLTISKSLPYFLELSAYGVTKGAALDVLAAHVGFARERTVCFGDGENDVELVAWGGFGVAVENAHARVKAVADWICPPAAEEGVAAVLEAVLARI